jgi:RNA polymerase sigma factor (sigma-70 family)
MKNEADESPSDELLMQQLATGNDAAFAPLMHRWEKPLRRFLFRIVLNAADADDLAQEVFVKIYQGRRRFAAGSRFSPWIFSIAANLAKNRLRWRRVRRLVSLDAPAGGERDADSSPRDQADPQAASSADWALNQERAAAVRAAIAKLPVDLRTALVLFEFEEQSHADIAAALGCTPKAVENRLYRARAALREHLGRWLATQ